MSTQAETWMKTEQLAGLGPRQTWGQWCASVKAIDAMKSLQLPGLGELFKDPREPWLTYWRNGLSAKEAMERVAGRKLK